MAKSASVWQNDGGGAVDGGCWMLDVGCWKLVGDSRYWMLGADTGGWMLDAGGWMLGVGYLKAGWLDAGGWILEGRVLNA